MILANACARRACAARLSQLARRLSSISASVAPLVAHSQEETERIGSQVAANARLRAGDVIFLKGDLGCGKTCFARGFIRSLARDAGLTVTSPTYLLVNTYELPAMRETPLVYHVDLYRLDRVSAQDVAALGLTEAFANGISLVEWPERLDAASVPAERLEVHIEYADGADGADASLRRVSFQPFGDRWTRSFVGEEWK